ncbi:hypothetical protein KHA80_07145 [Anaerobacillus sp. HL2]|nr:hypothetical protein KHA80_07145 [Anaerobacillus sp. HL2]
MCKSIYGSSMYRAVIFMKVGENEKYKRKLITHFFILITVASTLLSTFILFNASNSIVNEVEEGLQSLAIEGARLTESRPKKRKAIMEVLVTRVEIESMDWHQQPELQRQAIRN